MSSMTRQDVKAAFEALRNEPGSSPRWHALFHALHAAPETEQTLCWHRIDSELPSQGLAAFLRATLALLLRRDGAQLAVMRSHLEPDVPGFHQRCELLSLLRSSHLMGGLRSHTEARALDAALDLAGLFRLQVERLLTRGLPVVRRERLARVAVVAPRLGRLSHPPTRLVFDHVALLRRLGLEVHVFSPEETCSLELGMHCAVPIRNPIEPRDKAEWLAEFRHSVRVWAASPADPIEARWAALQSRVARFEPDLVFTVGTASLLPGLFWPSYPTMALGAVGLAPSAPADVWLRSEPEGDQIRYAFRCAFSAQQLAAPACTRAALRLPADGQVMVSVGNRLHEEIDDAFAQQIGALLEERPQLSWLLVGSPMPSTLAPCGTRVKVLPYREDLAAVLKACDLYLNPPRIGGGVSVAMAMAVGVPAVALSGSDGGDKLGAAASPHMASYLSRLRCLLDDEGERLRAAGAQRERYAKALDIVNAGPDLLAAMQLALQRFNRRSAAPASS